MPTAPRVRVGRRGEPGPVGPAPELRGSGGYLQAREPGGTWYDVVALTSITSSGTLVTFKGAVDDTGDLPSSGNALNDLYITTVSPAGHGYVWDGDSWEDIGSIVGPEGPAGDDGSVWLVGTGVPSDNLGADGDFYLDRSSPPAIYGPKAAGAWGIPVTLSDGGVTSVAAADITDAGATGITLVQAANAAAARTAIGATSTGSSLITAADAAAVRTAAGVDLTTIYTKTEANEIVEAVLGENIKFAPYNAVGNDSADDTTAIQAAFDAVEAAGRGAVYLPPGTYKTTSTLSVEASNVMVYGPGVIHYTGSATALRLGTKTTGAAIDGLTLRNFTIRGSSAGLCGLDVIGVQNAHFQDIRVENFTGTGAIGVRYDTQSVGSFVASIDNDWYGGVITNCYHGLKLTKDAADTGTDGCNNNTFSGLRVAAFTGIGTNVDFGEGNAFLGLNSSTTINGATGLRINDAVNSFLHVRTDNSSGVGNTATGIKITVTGTDHVIINPTGNGPTNRISKDDADTPGIILRNGFTRIVGDWDFDRMPTINGTPVSQDDIPSGSSYLQYSAADKAKVDAFDGTVTPADLVGAGTTGVDLLEANTVTEAKTVLSLTDTDLNTKFGAYNAAHPPVVAVFSDQPDPTGIEGQTLMRLAVQAAAKSAYEAFEGGTSTAATSFTFTPGTTDTDETVYLHIVAAQTAANVTAGRNAGYPAASGGVTGGGRTWSLITVNGNEQARSANFQQSSSVYKGVYSSGPTTADITVTMAAAADGTAPSATHDRIFARLVSTISTSGTVVQANRSNAGATSSSATLSSVNASNIVLNFISANSGGALTLTSTPAFTELTPQQTNTNPAIRMAASWAAAGAAAPTATATWTQGASAAAKINHVLELS